MPDIIEPHHNKFINDFINTGNTHCIGNTHKYVIAQHKLKFIVPLTLHITPFTIFEKGMTLVALASQDPMLMNKSLGYAISYDSKSLTPITILFDKDRNLVTLSINIFPKQI